MATLARPDLAVTLQRLGITTLGQFAALPAANVSDRFGRRRRRLPRAWPGARAGSWPACATRVSSAGSGWPGARTRPGRRPPPPFQPGFFGGASEADRRAARSFVKVQERLGIEAVLMGRVQGGRDPAGRSVLVPWGSPEAGRPARPAPRGRASCRRRRRPTCCAPRPGPS